jgi:hypothetical protein
MYIISSFNADISSLQTKLTYFHTCQKAIEIIPEFELIWCKIITMWLYVLERGYAIFLIIVILSDVVII